MTTPRPSYLLVSPTRTGSHHAFVRSHMDVSSSGSQNPHARAGASTIPPSSPTTPTAGRPVPGSSKMACQVQVASASRPPGAPQQEISEKVRDAFEDLELGQLSPVRAEATDRSHERSRSGSRGRRTDRPPGDASLDEKRALSERYGDTAFGRASEQRRQPTQGAGPALARTPVRSSSLSTASFATRPPFTSQPTDAVHLAPPPYSPHPTVPIAPLPIYPHNYSSYSSSVRRMLLIERVRPWLPFILYGATSLGFVVAIAFWKEEVFGGLDDLARWLRAEGETGYAVMFFMIFLTCIRKRTSVEIERTLLMGFISSYSTLLYPTSIIWVHIWCLDRWHHLVLCCAYRRIVRLFGFALRALAPKWNYFLLGTFSGFAACCTRNLSETVIAFLGSPCALSLQCPQCSSRWMPSSYFPYIHYVHSAQFAKSDHPHKCWCRDQELCRISRGT